LQELVDQGNTVIMVEHDMRIAAAADWLLDLGPGAGSAGGRIVAEGPPGKVAKGGDGVTARFLAAHAG
jgi:excinuclease ABC subunit A